MASVYIGNYHVYYSIVTGEIREFEECDMTIKGSTFSPVTEDYDGKLSKVVDQIIKSESFQGCGLPAFVIAIQEKKEKERGGG